MKIFSSRILFPPLTLCLCILLLELSSKCRASENPDSNSNATSRAFTQHGTGYNKKSLWRNQNVNSVKRDSGYGDNSNSNFNSNSAAAVAAVLNSDGNSGGQQSSFDSYSSSSYDNEGKAMGSNYADSYGVPSHSSSYGMSEYGAPQVHMMPEPSSMKYHYKVIPHQETSGSGWGEEDDGDSGLKEIIGTIVGIKGIKGLKGLKGLGLLSLPLLPFLPILIPLVLLLPVLPIIAIAGLFFFFPIPIITMPTRIGTAGTGAATNPISQVFPALFPINVGGRTGSEELWNASNLNEAQRFLSREASRVLNDGNYYSHFDYVRNMVKAVAQELYFSTNPSTSRSRDLKDDKSPNKNQCLERMACELTTFLRKISPKSSSFITGGMNKILGSGENKISRQIKMGMSSSPIEIRGNGIGSEVKVKSCKERFTCERLKQAEPPHSDHHQPTLKSTA